MSINPVELIDSGGWSPGDEPLPQINIAWDQSAILFSFTCSCGFSGIGEGEGLTKIRCALCGKIYEMPDEIFLDDGDPNDLVLFAPEML